MKKARLPQTPAESIGRPTRQGMVIASQIDPNNPPDDLLCPCCDVPVHYRGGTESANGGTEFTNPYFATDPGRKADHQSGCSYVSQDLTAQDGAPKTLAEAVETGGAMRINLNFIKSGVSHTLPPGRKPPITQELERWKSKHANNYLNISVKSLEDYVKAVRKIKKTGTDKGYDIKDVLDRTYVHFDGRVQSYHQFSGGQNSVSRMTSAFNDVANRPIANRSNRAGVEFNKGRPVVLGIDKDQWWWGVDDAGNDVAIIHHDNPLSVPQRIVFDNGSADTFKKHLDAALLSGKFFIAAEPVAQIIRPDQDRPYIQTVQRMNWKVRTEESVWIPQDLS